jgi:DNA-binding response OmpR family regulator
MSTVLVVDDVPHIRDIVTMFLTDEGYEVHAYGSCEEALPYFDRGMPDLVILDGRLPGMSGWQCLERLRAQEQTARLPVLMLTAAPKDAQQYVDIDADDCTRCLVKPFDLDGLLAALHEMSASCGTQLAQA